MAEQRYLRMASLLGLTGRSEMVGLFDAAYTPSAWEFWGRHVTNDSVGVRY